MHVLVLPSWYPTSADDPIGSFFREQAIALVRNRIKVGVITFDSLSMRNTAEFFRPKRHKPKIVGDDGISTLRNQYRNWFPRMPRVQLWVYTLVGLRMFKLYTKANGVPDIIHVHSIWKAGLIAEAIQKKYAIPFVVTEHSTAFALQAFDKSQISRMNAVVQKAKCAVAVSTPFAKLLGTTFNKVTWQTVPNIVRQDFFKPIIQTQRSNHFTFINICLLTKKKNVDVLLMAFAEAFEDNPSVDLIIGGGGEELEGLKKLAIACNIEEKVTFLGMLSRDEVIEAVSQADAFVLASEYETFGVVLIEALALGKPIIATRSGGPEDIVNDSNGILVPVNDQKSLSLSMQAMHEKRSSYNSRKIQKDCFEQYGEDAIATRLIDIYSNILQDI